jgi:outer membrane biosynthesis protein TonB
MNLEDRLRKALAGRRDTAPGADCPSPEALAAFVSGNRRKEIVEHLAGCPSCREDVLAARPPVPVARSYGWLAAAAAALFAVAIGAALMLGDHEPQPPIVVAPVPKPAPKPEPPKEPENPPVPQPETPKLAPKPEEKPAPKPEPEKPVIAKPAPEPEAPKPVPKPEEKVAPALTKAKLRGTLLAVAGGCASQAEGETVWQNAKLAQPREFSGSIRLRAETQAAKARIGAATYYLRGGTELAISIDEGVTTVRLAKGETLFDVTPDRDSFIVETATGKVAVKGTRFLVAAGEVVVQRGKVEFTAVDRTVAVSAGERSQDARAPEKTDVAKRLQWMKALDETLTIKPEAMTLLQGMVLLPDRTIGQKGPPAANTEPSAEIRVKRKQAAPYTVWIHLHWGHNVVPGFSVQVHDAPRWNGKDVTFNPAWQWVKVGTFELPDDAFRIRVTDSQGGLRFDQVLLTSDPDLVPDPR